jgi:hypothetical protein
MKEYMKDIIPKEHHRQYKAEFLNRSWEEEKNRIEIFKELVGLGMPHYNAYQISIRRMKI